MSKTIARLRFGSNTSRDSGVSLLEMLVAIMIVSIIATASGTFIIRGIAAAAAQERRQVAVTIASGLIETVSARGASIDASTTVTRAVTGRTQTSVLAAWTANAGKVGVAATTPAFDPTALISAAPAIPINATSSLSGTTYSSAVLIGTCWQPKAGGNCVAVASPTSSLTQLVRVIVIVRWTPGTACASNECFYQTSTLIDPHGDLEWVTNG